MKKLLTIALCLLSVPAFALKTIELNDKNTINFNQAFTSRFVAEKQLEAIKLCANNVGSEITIVAYSPGGSISAGQRFFDTLNALPCTFNTLTVFGASMSYQMTQQLGKRYILPSGILMSHRASVRGIGGEIGGELDSIINLLSATVTGLELVASKRVGVTLGDYKKEISDELWLTGAEAVAKNHADEMVLATCDESLLGTVNVTVASVFGAFDVEFSKCPIIIGPISVKPLSNDANLEKFTQLYYSIALNIKTTF